MAFSTELITKRRRRKIWLLAIGLGFTTALFLSCGGFYIYHANDFARKERVADHPQQFVKTGQLSDEKALEVATNLTMTEAFYWLIDIRDAEFGGPPNVTQDKSRGRYYRVEGLLKARYNSKNKGDHPYVVELSLDDHVKQGWVCHLLTIDGEILVKNR